MIKPHPAQITSCSPLVFCCGCAKDASWAGRRGGDAANLQRCQGTRKTSEGHSTEGCALGHPERKAILAPPKGKDVPFLHVTDSYKAKYWVLDHVLLGHPLLSKYSTKWCIWAINATQVLRKCVHFFTISFLFYIITYSDHFRANCLRNRSTAHS